MGEVKTFDVSFLDREHGESKWAFNWRSNARNVSRSLEYMAALRRQVSIEDLLTRCGASTAETTALLPR